MAPQVLAHPKARPTERKDATVDEASLAHDRAQSPEVQPYRTRMPSRWRVCVTVP